MSRAGARAVAGGVAGAAAAGAAEGAGPVWPVAGERVVETFRSASARGLAIVWWVLSALALGDLATGGRDHFALSIAAGIVLGDVLVWVGGWRPRVELYPAHVVLRGSLRDRVVRLAAITSTRASGPLVLTAGDRTLTSAVITSTLRERRRAAREQSAVPYRLAAGRSGRGRGLGRFAGGGGGMGGMGGGLGGPGGPGGGPTSTGFDDSRMDAATREAVVGRTAGTHAAERIEEEARRRRVLEQRAADQQVLDRIAADLAGPDLAGPELAGTELARREVLGPHPTPGGGPAGAGPGRGADQVSAGRWLPGPIAAVVVVLAAFVAVVLS